MLGKTNITTLDGGCVVVTSAMDSVESFAFGIDAGVGSRHEKQANAGWCHFIEHLLFKGSRKRPSTRAVSEPVEGRGGSINAYTAQDHTLFHAFAPYDAARVVVDTIGDIFTDPLIPQKEVERERAVVLEEMKMYHDDDSAMAAELAVQTLWPRHPLGRPILGFAKTLAAADSASLLDFRRDMYRAAGTIIVAAGRLEHAKIVDMAAPFAERLRKGAPVRPRSAALSAPVEPILFDRRETQQVQAVLSFRSVTDSDPRRTALSVLNHILGHGLTSRLFMSVREKRGLAYSIYSDGQTFADTGLFQVLAGVNPAKSVAAIELCGRELRRIATTAPGKAEFKRAVNCLVGQVRMSCESSRRQLAWVLDKARRLGRIETPEEVIDNLMAVTPEDVRAIAADMFRPENATLALVMPREGCETPEKHLAALRDSL